MFSHVVSHTSLLTAAARATESRREHALFDDPYAAELAGPEGEGLLAEVGRETAVPSIAIRTRYFDERIVETLGGSISQVVLLGSGLDARSHRLPLSRGVRWMEVDQRDVLAYKRDKLAKLHQEPRVDLRDVPGDVGDPAIAGALRERGLDPTKSVLWIAEGLLCFLEEAEIRSLFARITRISGTGSKVLFDVPSLACVKAQGEFARAGSALRKRGLRFGTDDPAGFAQSLGIDATFVHEGHPAAHFGRRPEPPFEVVDPARWTVFFVHGDVRAPAA